MSDEAKNEEKKIIVDEDWKSQVQAEKEAAQGGAAQGSSVQGGAAKDEPATETEAEPATDESQPLPPPDFAFMISSFYVQGMVSLGLMTNPMDGQKMPVQLDHAKHSIDTLEMLQEKTKGNLTPDEQQMLEDVLHQLRMAFVAVKEKQE